MPVTRLSRPAPRTALLTRHVPENEYEDEEDDGGAPGFWRRARGPLIAALGVLILCGVVYLWLLDRRVHQRFETLAFAQPSRVFARPLALAPGAMINAVALDRELAAARYTKVDGEPFAAGTYRKQGDTYSIATRAFGGPQGAVQPRRLRVVVGATEIRRVEDLDRKQAVRGAELDPARIATLYGAEQQERRFVRAEEVPPLLIATLQAVEDRDFKSHNGIDLGAIARAALSNARAGEVVQGGSTHTQQLVRNLWLTREQSYSRKINEALMALAIEARYDKKRILEAYLNQIFLGQQGGQAVHGVAAASEFWFGRELNAIGIPEVALMIGMIRGPSFYDPRRFPDRARARRDRVLGVMHEVGLITDMERRVAVAAPLGVGSGRALTRNRYPAFLEVVRLQLQRDFPDAALRGQGLSVFTTLAPSAQAFADEAVASTLKSLGTKGRKLEAAVVVVEPRSGALLAIVGARQGDSQGYNRALSAQRPIGSLVKPFVYLLALAQPQNFSLMTPLPDRALTVPIRGSKSWTPKNVDGVSHGDVSLLDALARSYNLATVHLGLEIGVARVERLLESLIPGADISPHPSLLLGATDLSPMQVAQAYQYLAADGVPQPLRALDAVLDADGQPLTRYRAPSDVGALVQASRLTTYALQETARRGTASALTGLGLAKLAAAGKTGTSNDNRDSWFAGYTGSHLAVVWLGADDNSETGLYGSTGALKVWAGLFNKLPSKVLEPDLSSDPHLVWVDMRWQSQTDPNCPGARTIPFAQGFEPERFDPCYAEPPQEEDRGWFDWGQR